MNRSEPNRHGVVMNESPGLGLDAQMDVDCGCGNGMGMEWVLGLRRWRWPAKCETNLSA